MTEHARPPHRALKLAGLVVLVVAISVAAAGILGREQSRATLAQSTAAQALPQVRIIHAKTDVTPQTLVLPGDVRAWEEAPIYARVSGYLKTWTTDIGAQVHTGDVLGRIEAPDLDQQLDQARAKLSSTQADTHLAALTAKRWTALLGSQAVSQQSADEKTGDAQAKASLVNAADAGVKRLEALESFKRVTAPFDGIVTARNTDVGDLITVGTGGRPLFTVSDTHKMRVYVRVPQTYAARLRPGMTADLTLTQYPGEIFHAVLLTTSNAIAEASRTVLVQLVAENADGRLWTGAYAEVRIALPPDAGVLTVPATALLFRPEGMAVATLGPADRVAMRPITIRRDLGTVVEVTGGVTATDSIIDNPADTLATGTQVAVAGTPEARTVADAEPDGR